MAIVTGDNTCPRCGKPLDPSRTVDLELNCATGLYSEPGTVPEDESQGLFRFGADCARAIRRAGGDMRRVGLAKRLSGE